MRVKSVFSSFVLIFLLLLPLVIAQSSEVFTKSLLRAILGPLPQACSISLSSSDCIACMGTAKILPFVFFFGLIYFAMAFIIFRMIGGFPTLEGRQTPFDIKGLSPSYYYAAILIALVVALMSLHVREISGIFISFQQLQQILLITFSIVIVITFLFAIRSLSPLLGVAILLISVGIVWTYYTTLTEPGGLLSMQPEFPIRENLCFLIE